MTQQLDEAPVIDHEVLQEIQNHFGSLEADYRANVPEGSVIAQADVQGGVFNIIKGSSLAKLQGKSMPGRTLVYDTKTGMTSKVPTRSLMYQLGKRRPDGSRVYSLQPPEGVVLPVPIDDTCVYCQKSRNGKKRDFFSEDQLVIHYQLFHTLEWNGMERNRDIHERREDATRMERLITGLATALRPDLTDKLPADVKEQITKLQATTRNCEACGEPIEGADSFAKARHMKTCTAKAGE